MELWSYGVMVGMDEFARRCLIAAVALLLWAGGVSRADLLGRGKAEEAWAAGQSAMQDGFYALAATKFRVYVDETYFRNNKARGSALLAQALLAQGRSEEAVQWLEKHREWAEGSEAGGAYTYWLARGQFELARYSAVTDTLFRFERIYEKDENLTKVFRLRTAALIKLGLRENAYRSFASFQERYPTAPEVPDNLLDWARLLVEDGRPAEAEPLLRRIVKEYPDSVPAQSARLWLGRMLMDRQAYAQALVLLDALARPPGAPSDLRAQAWYALGRLAEGQTNLVAALDAYTQGETTATDPGLRLENRISRARLTAQVGQPEQAAALLAAAVKSVPTHARTGDVQLELATVLQDQGQPAEALAAYQSYLEAFSDEAGQARALLGKGWCLWALERYAEAALVFEKAAALQTTPEARETAWLKAADAYFANSQFKLAEEAYQRLLNEFPASVRAPQALFQTAECRARGRDFEGAQQAFSLVRERFPKDPLAARAALRTAGLREEEGRWDDAVNLYNQYLLLATAPEAQAEALFRSGVALYRGGRFNEALARFEKVLADFPKTTWSEQAYYLRGWALHLMGETRRGLQVARQFLENYPESPWAPEVLFWLGEQQFNRGQYKESESIFRDLVTRFPASGQADDALYWAGRSAAGQTEYRRAIATYNDLIRTYTNSPLAPEARFAQGDALSELGEFSGAILAFDDIVRTYPASLLVDRARGRRGDCQFTLGADRPERYQEALASFRSILDSTAASPSLKLQAEYKTGRCLEKMGRRSEAFESYMNVVYGWLGLRERGQFAEPVWFTRAAFAAAALKEADQQRAEAVRIYERVLEAGIPAGADAAKRIESLRGEAAGAPR